MTANQDLFKTLTIGEPLRAGAAFMFPVFGQTIGDKQAMETLDEALEAGSASVAEVSAQGSVPELVIVNLGKECLFLLDGEQILGAKQNRTFNLSMLLPPSSETVVPVSCLESGRWSMRGGKVRAAGHAHFASGRANKLRSVSESLANERKFASDQHQVWSDIDAKFAAGSRQSETSSEAEYFAGREAEIEPNLTAFEAEPNQCGAIVGVGSRIVGVDVFATSELYSALGMKLLKSYLLDAVDERAPAAPPSIARVKDVVKELFAAPAKAYPAPGLGETLRWSSPRGSGAMLVNQGRCVHAVAFCDA